MAFAGWLAGCSLGNDFSTLDSGSPPLNARDASASDAGVEAGSADATTDGAATPAFQGNPLCHASRAIGACYPDDPITPITATACNEDGGGGDSGAGLACHVSSSGSLPVCLPAGHGMDGDPCMASTDCAGGFECAGSGTCRPYCCSGLSRCAAGDDAGGTGEFCDIQQATGTGGTEVPVCMPIRSCNLLDQLTHLDGGSQCGSDETCAVVRGDNGATSCVAIGTAMVGDPCDTEHCAAGLVCLGTSQRKCYELCLTPPSVAPAVPPCPAGLTCKGGQPLFPDLAVGICDVKL
jgi:hypothetical protein